MHTPLPDRRSTATSLPRFPGMSASKRSLRVVFLVQGEGRGHLSQALALQELLSEGGHRVVGLLVGGSERRPLPPYFAAGMGLPPVEYPSLLTVPGRDRAGVSPLRTITHNLRRLPRYRAAVRTIRDALLALTPDLVVNFYESLGGIAMASPPLRHIPMVSVGHQYLLGHPDTPAPPFRPHELLPFRVLNRLSARPGTPRLALSFREIPDGPGPDTRVVPPLLRRRIMEAESEPGEHILVYVLNDGYGDAVARWHQHNPGVVVHAFWDRPGAPESEEVRPNLTFHRLSDVRFLELMRTCRGYVGTAGFESVAEALWLGKPVMVVPTRNHVEQGWNAREAEVAGAGIAGRDFDLGRFLDYLPRHTDRSNDYRRWVLQGNRRVLELLETAAGLPGPVGSS